MSKRETCQHEILVVGEACRVDRCSHGRVHMTVGNLTLRMRPSAFIALATALNAAAARLEMEAAEGGATRLLC